MSQTMRIFLGGLAVLPWTLSGDSAIGQDSRRGATPLWQIGRADNSTAEFALAPKDYQAYRRPGFFVVGLSDTKRDWPYVQPGTRDGWAAGTAQTFEILFGLETPPKSGDCRLLLDLVDSHSAAPPRLRIDINGRTSVHQTPKGTGDASVFGDPSKGREHVIVIDVPADSLKKGDNRIAITTVRGSWVLWDAVRFEAPAGAKLAAVQSGTRIQSLAGTPALVRHNGQLVQPIAVDVMHVGEPIDVTVQAADAPPLTATLQPGRQILNVHAPQSDQQREVPLLISAGDRLLAKASVSLKPVRKWEVHLVHQTHLDIGYTHTQEEVLRIQVDHLRKALQYIEQSKDYPEEAQFKWHPEGMWAVEEFMRGAPEAERETFLDACRKGLIHLDVLYAQAMTGMYTEEELFELMGAAKRFERKHGVKIDSAMQSDVPGYTWGLASALAHHGVNYLSVGPNPSHRLGHLYAWGDKPFWWVGPSGQHKVLFWMAGKGYWSFHGKPIGHRLAPQTIFDYLDALEKEDYTYDMVLLRYNIGADNGPPNPVLPDVVKEWNEKFAYPRLIIARNGDVLKEFARRYGDQIPVVTGDFTPYWEDGSASTSLATSVNRRACDKIAQTQILWAMLNPALELQDRFDAAWTKLIMYDEHTWGAHNSISQPDHPFAIRQDEYKQAFAFDGSRMTDALLADVSQHLGKTGSHVIDVYNTASWSRHGLVLVGIDESAAGDLVKDNQDRPLPSQRLASGELAFVARDVPAFGARRYSLHAGDAHRAGAAEAINLKLANGLVSLEIDPHTGAINTLRHQAIDNDLVDTQKAPGLNDYLYIIGRDAGKNRSIVRGPAKVTVEDAGPVVATLRIETDAPGCQKLIRRVRLVDGFDHVELINTTDKLKERRPEGVYFGFPLFIPHAVSRIDVPWAVVQVEKDQLKGANRNFYCVQRWVDLSNDEYGVTWVTVDAPMLQFDPIKITGARGAQGWRTSIDPGAFIHSWVMNNHWETNYKADQEGLMTFRYVLRPHAGGYDGVAAQRFGRDICQPFVVVPADPDHPVTRPRLRVDGEGVVVTMIRPSRDGKATMIRLFAASGKPERFTLHWSVPGITYVSSPAESRGARVQGPVDLPGFGIVTLRVEPAPERRVGQVSNPSWRRKLGD